MIIQEDSPQESWMKLVIKTCFLLVVLDLKIFNNLQKNGIHYHAGFLQ